MKKRKLGKTGIEVSELAFGTVELGIPYGIGIEHSSQLLPEVAAIELLQTALNRGVNFFDTARQYGNSEALLGRAFKDRRQEVVIATKCVHLRNKEHIIPAEKELTGMIEQSLAQSLEALQSRYVDVLMLHDGDEEILRHPVIKKVLERFKKEGLIRASGVSTYTPQQTQAAIETGGWDMVQVPFNLMDQRQSALFEALEDAGVGAVIRSVLLKGLLSNRAGELHPALKTVAAHITGYQEMVKAAGCSLPELATKFVLAFPEVASVLIGIDKMAYLETALNAVEGAQLPPVILESTKKAAYPNPDFLNLHEWSVNGWLK